MKHLPSRVAYVPTCPHTLTWHTHLPSLVAHTRVEANVLQDARVDEA